MVVVVVEGSVWAPFSLVGRGMRGEGGWCEGTDTCNQTNAKSIDFVFCLHLISREVQTKHSKSENL